MKVKFSEIAIGTIFYTAILSNYKFIKINEVEAINLTLGTFVKMTTTMDLIEVHDQELRIWVQ